VEPHHFNVERLNSGKPILEKIQTHPWENKVVFNPACILVQDKDEIEKIISSISKSMSIDIETIREIDKQDAICFLIYRAQGERTKDYDHRRSSLGLAILTPELKLLKRFNRPILKPEEPYENFGIEDPRITKIDNKYFMLYTGLTSESEETFNRGENRPRICLAVTEDFVNWEKYGPLKGDLNNVDNKNAVLFPDKIDNKFHLLHRPMQGKDAMKIHLAVSDSIFGIWRNKGVLIDIMDSSKFEKTWIGAGAPPLKISKWKFLLIYHIGNMKKDGTREYNLGIALINFNLKNPLAKRYEPFMRPETEYELKGDRDLGVDNVLFICGAYFYKDYLYLPYAGADSAILASRIKRDEILKWLESM
jgi:predicted GH43/DUF377 family glycosyl hydrolase